MEIWPQGLVSKPAMLNGTWKRALSTLGPAMQRQNFSGVVLDLEELKDTRQVIPTPLHVLGRISPIFPPFFPVFCAFSPPR